MRRLIRKLVAAAGPAREPQTVERLVACALDAGADALAILGGLAPGEQAPRDYRRLLHSLAQANLPTFFVPGAEDAPIQEYLQEAYNIEIVYPFMHGVHGTFALGPGSVVVAGMGGEIVDDPKTPRDEVGRLRYPGWEVEYRLKVLEELKDYQRIFLFATPPAHKGLREPGSEVLAEMVKSYKPRLVLFPGAPRQAHLGSALLAAAGRLEEGECTLVDVQESSVEAKRLR
ncbi:MAG TPA: heat-stable protein [Thermodesulfobacteriota bacterium]|nr:heat-stable protein [Thermodesulfobacteriota bacterium]